MEDGNGRTSLQFRRNSRRTYDVDRFRSPRILPPVKTAPSIDPLPVNDSIQIRMGEMLSNPFFHLTLLTHNTPGE